jgi:hypothetical protein
MKSILRATCSYALLIVLGGVLFIASSAQAETHSITVTASAGAFSPNPVAAEQSTSASLNAEADESVVQEEGLTDPLWSWSVTAKKYSMESASGPWTDGSCTVNISPSGETEDPSRTATASAVAGYWKITFKAHVKFVNGDDS